MRGAKTSTTFTTVGVFMSDVRHVAYCHIEGVVRPIDTINVRFAMHYSMERRSS